MKHKQDTLGSFAVFDLLKNTPDRDDRETVIFKGEGCYAPAQ
jgi:hypothetical protein